MPKYEKFHKHDRKPNQAPRESEPQVEDEEDVKWNPTPEVFEGFLKRDAELCAGNLRLVLSSRPGLSIKEMKDSTLHSSEAVDRQVMAWLQAGVVTETKVKNGTVYSLAQVAR
jgi:hypothetical protein